MRSNAIQTLRTQLASVSRPTVCGDAIGLPFGVALAAGRLHEWYVGESESSRAPDVSADVPLSFFADIARRALMVGTFSRLAWVGFDSLPYPSHLGTAACRASVLVDLPPSRDPAHRLWTIDLLARSSTPVVVFARAERLTLAHTRRLQLAASSGRGLCMIARPMRELSSLSAAATRWRVEPAPSPSARPRWTVTRLRDKDRPASRFMDEPEGWALELHGAAGLVHLPPVAGDGSVAAGFTTGERAAS